MRLTLRARLTAAALLVYVAAIVASNWLITHVGIPAGPGTYLSPVGFGLMAPSGVWAAAVSFPARDITQRLGGRWPGIAAIAVAAVVSWAVSSPAIAVASGGTYLVSETCDMAVYSPLQRRWFVPAVVASGAVAIVADSVVFLHWAGLYSTPALQGLILGKAWVILVSAPVTWLLRNCGPLKTAAATV